MIMCADHHCNIDLCGCDADEQYRRAQETPPNPEKTEDMNDLAALRKVAEEARERLNRVLGASITLRVPQVYNRDGRADWSAFADDISALLSELEAVKGESAFIKAESERQHAMLRERLGELEDEADAAEQALSDLKREVLEKVGPFLQMAKHVQADVSTAHSLRGDGASQWMREDDNEFRRDLREALRALSSLHERVGQPPSSDPVTTSDQGAWSS